MRKNKIELRKCTGCMQLKPELDFPFKDKEKKWRRSRCIPCFAEWQRGQYKKHIYSRREKALEKDKDVRNKIDDYLTGKSCNRCGNKDKRVFEFHHIDPSTKIGTISRLARTRTWDFTLLEIAKCEILCANCHRIEHKTQWSH